MPRGGSNEIPPANLRGGQFMHVQGMSLRKRPDDDFVFAKNR